MRKFIIKTVIIVSLSTLSITTLYIVMFVFSFVFSLQFTNIAKEVFYVIDKARYCSDKTIVILGDSVCNQLWPQTKDSINISHLGCNQAITTAGTYLLLVKYLANNPQTEEVFYILCPQNLGNDMNLDYTYQYFVIPFMNGDNVHLIDNETTSKLYNKFGKIFVTNGFIKNLLLNNNLLMTHYINHIKAKQEQKYIHRLSRTAIIYLPKIQELCRKYNAKLRVLPIPVPDVEANYGWEKFDDDVMEYGLDDILGNFTKKIHYCPKEWYRDGIHFKPDILEKHLDELRAYVMD